MKITKTGLATNFPPEWIVFSGFCAVEVSFSFDKIRYRYLYNINRQRYAWLKYSMPLNLATDTNDLVSKPSKRFYLFLASTVKITQTIWNLCASLLKMKKPNFTKFNRRHDNVCIRKYCCLSFDCLHKQRFYQWFKESESKKNP